MHVCTFEVQHISQTYCVDIYNFGHVFLAISCILLTIINDLLVDQMMKIVLIDQILYIKPIGKCIKSFLCSTQVPNTCFYIQILNCCVLSIIQRCNSSGFNLNSGFFSYCFMYKGIGKCFFFFTRLRHYRFFEQQ